MPFRENLSKVPLQCSLLPCNFHLRWEKLLPKSHSSPSFLRTAFCPPSASTPLRFDLHYPPVVYYIPAIPYVLIHLSWLDFAISLIFFLFFFLAYCSSTAFTQHLPDACCSPHTHIFPASLSYLTLSIKCPQSQRGICSPRRLLQVPTALQIHQHRAQGCLQIKVSFKGSQRLAACGNFMRQPRLSSWRSKTVFLMENQAVILF